MIVWCKSLLIGVAVVAAAVIGLAQFPDFYGGGRGGDDREQTVFVTESGFEFSSGYPRSTGRGIRVDETSQSTAREVGAHATDLPTWTNAPGFEKDVFTFCRARYISAAGGYRRIFGNWMTDFPDSDMNLSFRLQQMTSLKVDPNGRFLRLNNKDLYNYPWIYVVEPGHLLLNDEEVKILRDYLTNGGFLMADDFWGESQWENFYSQMKRVFPEPEREFVELPMDHPVFHTVFDIQVPKQKLQTPNVWQAIQSLDPNNPEFGITWEARSGPGAEEMHVRAILDAKGRIMVIATHNCDNGDGWEREGEHDEFFHAFSEQRAFPLGINIIFYAMTH
jgi:hypothetical protein